MTKLFLTGATGYIGSSVLETLVAEHPEWDYTVLLRSEPDGFRSRYPSIEIVRGDYDAVEMLTEAASQVDIVVHSGDSDHEPSIKALLKGLESRKQRSFLVHLGGTGIMSDWNTFPSGELNDKVWSDVDDIDAIWSLPDSSIHRNVDKIIQQTAEDPNSNVRVAIVCPPDIYGRATGLTKRQSFFTPFLWEEAQNIGATFYANSGTNTRSFVHLNDLLFIYVKLVEAAARGGDGADWNHDGYYFSSSQEYSMRDLATAAGKFLHARGLLPAAEPKQLTTEELKGLLNNKGYGHVLPLYIFGANSRSRPDRARKLFGYKPSSASFLDVLGADLEDAVSGTWQTR